MNGIGFDNDKYLTLQSQHIRQRIANEYGYDPMAPSWQAAGSSERHKRC